MSRATVRCTIALAFALGLAPFSTDACPSPVPVQGAPLVGSLQVFPGDNWWNVDIRSAPVDSNSANYIAFINNGGTRRLHPDFGGEESPGSVSIYGFPYVVVDSAQARLPVSFEYWDESDGVDYATGEGLPFYPIPAQAITQPHWIEGGAPGNVDQRDDNDRHLLLVDCLGRSLYELYNVYYNAAQQRWQAGSGAFFDLTRNDRRPEGWTSADAAGLAIFPGLVRYDEAGNAAVLAINHAFRVTVRATNGYVYPASHRAGSTSGALPMGARLRLKQLVDGQDPALRTADPIARKIFRAMQVYGLVVADNGSDMYISGTFDVRWNNGILNPAFRTLSASDFEVVQLGWRPPPAAVPVLQTVSVSPNPVVGGQPATGTVSLDANAGADGANVQLASASPAFSVPARVTVSAGAASAIFPVTTAPVTVASAGTLSATFAGVTRTTALTVTPDLPRLSIADAAVSEGDAGERQLVFTVKLSRASRSSVVYDIATSNGSATAGTDYVARSQHGASIAAGSTGARFAVRIRGDGSVEDNETFLVSLSNVSGAIVADAQATGTIRNDDGPTLAIGDASIVEGAAGTSTMNFTVRLSEAAPVAVGYTVASANGSASAGSDFVALAATGMTMPPGQTQQVLAVSVIGDATIEGNETLFVNLSAASAASIADGLAAGTIVNDDGPTLSVDDVSVVEGNAGTTVATFTVRLSQAAASTVRYAIGTDNGSALAGSDYHYQSLNDEHLRPGQTSRSFSVGIVGDAIAEADERFLVRLLWADGASISDGDATATILNDEAGGEVLQNDAERRRRAPGR